MRSLLLVISLLAACSPSSGNGDTPPAQVELGTLPYHPLVYHLDLSILAYQLHGQSLVWPFDAFYEERAEPFGSTRDDFMDNVRAWALTQPNSSVLDSYRGPGIGLDQNASHDPVLYNYSRIHPWSSNVMNADSEWTEYLTPREITARINQVYVAYRHRPTGGSDEVRLEALPQQITPGDRDADASDVLLAFEGGTGDKGEANMPASQSLMGFVLLRSTGASSYDVHVSFRGSRSGTAGRAFFEALSTNNASGNPDWITDLGFASVPEPLRSSIATTGNVARGFATSMKSILPQLIACLQKTAELRGGSPNNIYVTGHSLGGALAQHFASAVLIGDDYGPAGSGTAMPAMLRSWPWSNLKLITYGAPRAGDESWARELTTEQLQSPYYDRGFVPFDDDALRSIDSSIGPRLIDPSRPVGYRVLISTDPITNAIPGEDGGPVGQTVYVNKTDSSTSVFGVPSPDDHEPEAIRNKILGATADPRTPRIAWRYRPLSELPPERSEGERGSQLGFQKLRDATLDYYSSRGLWFDQTAFVADFMQLLLLQ
ncbi:MAG: hypothetical protein ACI8UD_002467 [Planctomycetota bacterium]|jgi:hypothetical protein